MTGAVGYAERYLSQAGDYYSQQEKITGHWYGRGAELLGLHGEVQMAQFEAIRQGLDHSTGEALRPRQSSDRFNAEGERIGTARNLYDFTVSAPKSVSVQALQDPRLLEAHDVAVQETAQEMERLAATRIRMLGANDNRITCNLVMAVYRHDTSRELDPQIHSHLVAGNLTYDGAEGRWKALQASEIYQQRAYLTEVYRNALAAHVHELGYATVDRFEAGQERGFEIEGVQAATLEKFSQRSAQRDRAVAEFLDTNDRLPTNNEIARLIRATRADKLTEISPAEAKARQWARMNAGEAASLQAIHSQATERGSLRQETQADLSLTYAREHVFERVSVAKEHELKLEALRHGRGRLDLDNLKTSILFEANSGALLKAGDEVATRESLARERQMVETVNRGVAAYRRLGGSREFAVSDRLRPEQKHAVLTVLDSRDLAINLRGAAGSGKTVTLQELKRGLTEARRGIVAVAPTTSAVEELEKVGFAQPMTISRLLQDPNQQHQLADQVLIVDEAGMVLSRHMAELLQLAKRANAQIVLSGDTAQIKSVEEGDALRVLERESKLRTVSLSQVQRQTLTEYREAVEDLRQNPAAGFSKFEQMGAIREVDWRLRAQEVSRAYREALAHPNAKAQRRSVLVVAGTHDEIRNVTHAIRRDRRMAGELGLAHALVRHEPLNWTEAQKRRANNYQPGLVLEFHKATKGVGKNEALEVVRADNDGITARNPAGREVRLTRRQTKAFSVFEHQAFEVSTGDKLLLQANRRDKSFRATNGQLVTVASVEAGRIHLEDGRTLPADYRQMDHGYAVTAHKSQAKTVDAVIISGDRMPRDLFYVAATRGRESLIVITSDKEQLRESIDVTGERQSATELARRVSLNGHDIERLRYAFDSLGERLSVSAQEGPSVSHEFQQQQTPAVERKSQEVQNHEFSITM